jgi:hypothetical protein
MTYPFTGTVMLDAQIKLLGTRIRRRVRFTYGYTPEWPFYDPETGTEKTADEAMSLGLEIEVKPRTMGWIWPKGAQPKPYWKTANELLEPGILNGRIYDRLDALIDVDARAQDLERRQEPGSKPSLPNAL